MIAVFALLALLASVQGQCQTNGQFVNGACWYIAFFNTATDDCNSLCDSLNANAETSQIVSFAGSGAADQSGCQDVVNAFGLISTVSDVSGATCGNSGIGCFFNVGQTLRCTSPSTLNSATATFPAGGRFCACDDATSSGFTDPHFSGFNGEALDVRHNSESTNKFFNLFCADKVALNAYFASDVEDLLYMEQFVAKFGDFEFTMTTSELNINGDYKVVAINGDIVKYSFEGGYAVASNGDISIHYNDYIYELAVQQGETGKYLNNYIQGPRSGTKASGIVGRTLVRAYSEQEFAEYSQFERKSANDFTCEF